MKAAIIISNVEPFLHYQTLTVGFIMKKVVLFRSVSEEYQKAFGESIYDPVYIEPLQFEYINVEKLNEALQMKDYDGLILTSPRSVEALSKCWNPSKFMLWNTKKIYTVGDATCNKIKLLLGLEAIGMISGNAQNLAEIIVKDNQASSKFLFPSSNLSSETLAIILEAKEISVTLITAYETKENENLKAELMELNSSESTPCGLVFFSPSGCEYVHRQLQTFRNKLSHIPHFAIGNSTAHKIENLGLEIAGVASKPKAECVIESINSYFTINVPLSNVSTTDVKCD